MAACALRVTGDSLHTLSFRWQLSIILLYEKDENIMIVLNPTIVERSAAAA